MFSSFVKCPDLVHLYRWEDVWFLGARKKRGEVADGHRVSSEWGGKKCSRLTMVMVAQQIPGIDENR